MSLFQRSSRDFSKDERMDGGSQTHTQIQHNQQKEGWRERAREGGRAGAGRQTGIGKEILSVVCIWNKPDISY